MKRILNACFLVLFIGFMIGSSAHNAFGILTLFESIVMCMLSSLGAIYTINKLLESDLK